MPGSWSRGLESGAGAGVAAGGGYMGWGATGGVSCLSADRGEGEGKAQQSQAPVAGRGQWRSTRIGAGACVHAVSTRRTWQRGVDSGMPTRPGPLNSIFD